MLIRALPRAAIFLLLGLYANTASAEVTPFAAVFSVGNDTFNAGDAKLTLVQNDGVWNYSLITAPKGIFKLAGKGYIAEKSELTITDGEGGPKFKTDVYSYRQDEETKRSVDATFDWNEDSVTYTRRGETKTLQLEEPIMDRLSVTLAVMETLKGGFDTAEFTVFDNGSIETIKFINEGKEELTTKMGSFETIRVRRENAKGSSRHSMVWFAPLLDYIPVRLEQYKRDELVARMSLVDLQEP